MNAAPNYRHTLQVGPFLQDVATFYICIDGISTQKVLALVCMNNSAIYAGTEAGLACFDARANRWRAVTDPFLTSAAIRWLSPSSDGGLWIGTMQKACHLPPGANARSASEISGEVIGIADLQKTGNNTWILLSHLLIDAASAAQFPLPDGVTGRTLALLSDGVPVIATDRGLFRLQDNALRPVDPGRETDCHLDPDIRALAADDVGGLWIATGRGLNYYMPDGWLAIIGKDGLPIENVTHLAVGPESALWIGGEAGIARLLDGEWRYYAGKRWLPHDKVNALVTDADGSAWVATDGGIARIAFAPMTFPQKAAHYERVTAARHDRDGYVTDCHLTRPGDLDSCLYEASDNDGLWTSLYVCAESFRHAVTGEPEARNLARRSLNALLELVRVTGIPGFPARAVIRAGERVHQSDPGSNWYRSPVEPDVLYKDDTSSDEVDGHYLAWYVYSELVADTDEKAAIAEVCRAVTNHILDHNYTLVGPTGKHTRWGVWNPDWLNHGPHWAAERGLNSLEILSHLKVAFHLCGDTRFHEAYHTLIAEHHFALNTVFQKLLPPEGENNHSDDELAAVAYYPLLQLERLPSLRRLYLLSLERTQAILRPERSPFHNCIYGACTGRPCDAESAAQWLRDAPLDLRGWTMTNSLRADVTFDLQPDRSGRRQLTRALPPNETHVAKWNHNPYIPDGGSGGAREEDGAFWLLPYWMARYHGILRETG
jgi:hypothetical protein